MRKRFTMPPDLPLKVGTTRVTTLARQQGVSLQTLRWHLSTRHGLSPRREAVLAFGISVADVAQALGIDASTVYRYIDRGLLQSHAGQAITRSFFSIALEDVSDFIATVGGLLPLHPAPAWRAEYAHARRDLHRRYISGVALADALVVPRQHLAWLRLRHDLPEPTFRLGALGAFYDRAAVRAWLDDHGAYDRPGTRAALDSFPH